MKRRFYAEINEIWMPYRKQNGKRVIPKGKRDPSRGGKK